MLSDIKMDYPLEGDIYKLIDSAKSKTICESFEEQLEVSEKLYGYNIHFNFTKKDVQLLLRSANIYSEEIITRVQNILFDRMRIYDYLFTAR